MNEHECYDGKIENNTELAAEIQRQIVRFGLQDTEQNCNGLVAYTDDGNENLPYPYPVIRLDGDGATTYIDGTASLRLLKESAEPEGNFERDQEHFYRRLVQIDENDTDYCEVLEREQLEDGTCNDNPNTVLRVRLANGAVGWVAGPHGTNYCAIRDWLDNVGNMAETRAQAIRTGTSDYIAE